MTEDASLTDFDAGTRSSEAEADGKPRGADPPADGASERAATDEPDPVADAPDPATSTYRWSSDGASCPDCGRAVERRWRDGDRLVCADCKDW